VVGGGFSVSLLHSTHTQQTSVKELEFTKTPLKKQNKKTIASQKTFSQKMAAGLRFKIHCSAVF
jgi:hypothetical protein